MLRWVRGHFKCTVCSSRKRPQPARPTQLPRSLKFNEVVGLDMLFYVFEGRTYNILNRVDWEPTAMRSGGLV